MDRGCDNPANRCDSAACDSDLWFTTGGDAEWFAQSAEYYADNDAAQSGTIGSGQETWMQTTVVGPGHISFYYKMSSVSGDALAFYVDAGVVASWSQGSTWPWTGNISVPAGPHTLRWKYYKYSGSTEGSCWIDAIQWQPQVSTASYLQDPLDTDLVVYTGGDSSWSETTSVYYYDSDSAYSGWPGDNKQSMMLVNVEGPGTVTFWWKVSSEANYDWLSFYADGVLQDRISGEVGWQQKSYPLSGDGTHALVWVYSKDSSSESGSDRGWVDYLQWTPSGGGGGSSTTDWEQITYTYDPSGRRIAKDVDGVVTKYVYDGDQCIAEYDANDTLLRKYIHGPGIDQPICMIEVADANAAYFYHFDALGSVVALSDADGDTVQVYEYDVYGQVAASDPNHPNRFMFTGREFDAETGLYYYRARYYNPAIGRFLQTDPIQYGVGLNAYTYCLNSPVILSDPTGLEPQLVHNEPGWIYDQWEREEGHAAVPEGYGPFYQQQHKYSCAGVAILNLWLMYDRSPWAGQMKSDLDAEEWVLDRLEYAMGTPGQDWDKQGTDNMWTLAAVAQVSGVGLNVETYRHRTAAVDGILTALSAKKAVIIEMTLNVGTAAQCRHAVLLTPTPLDWVEDGSGKYTLVDSATYFVYGIPPLSWDTLDDLRKWLNALVETHADSDTGYNRLERSIAVAGSPVVQ